MPREYRQYVRDGILEWNKAFEKIGFIDAIQVRDQQSDDEFDPEDIRYNTFRWISTSGGFAIGPSRTNPQTGEILDAGIVFDEGMIRYLRGGISRHGGRSRGHGGPGVGPAAAVPQALRSGLAGAGAMGAGAGPLLRRQARGAEQFRRPAGSLPTGFALTLGAGRLRECEMGPGMQRQLALAASILAARGDLAPDGKVPEKLIAQAVKEIVMHEVGHTLGLRHNFKASSIYRPTRSTTPSSPPSTATAAR